MAMGRRKKRVRQEGLWIPATVLPVGASHPFYQRLNQILDEKKFDEYVEAICEQFYADEVGRPEFQHGGCFRFEDAFHQHLSGAVTDRNRDACLMHVHANILSVVHWVLLSVGPEPTPQAYFERGALFL